MVSTLECFGIFFSFSLNFCLIIDLIKMMRDPFSDKEKFMRHYLIITPTISFLIAGWFTFILAEGKNSKGSSIVIFIAFIIMFFLGIYSIVLANEVLNKPGISGAARLLILKRHAATISIFFICNLYVFVFTIYDIFDIPIF
jgi:preprotein translocase subunit SecY